MINLFYHKRAMTLVEAIFCIAAFPIIAGACFMLLHLGWDSWHMASARAELSRQLNQTSFWVFNELRQSAQSTITDVPADGTWYSSISFKKAQAYEDGNITWGPVENITIGGGDGKQVLKTIDAQTVVVANHMNALQFRRQSATPNMIEVQAQASVPTNRANEQLTAAIQLKVCLRN